MLFLLLPSAASAAEWTDVTGKRKIRADFDRLEHDRDTGAIFLHLKKRNGQTFKLTVEQLSDASKRAVAEKIGDRINQQVAYTTWSLGKKVR